MADRDNRGFYAGLPSIPQFEQQGAITPRMISTSVSDEDGPIYRYQGLVTYEKPIREFPADILIPVNAAGSVTNLRSGSELPNNCVGVRFISLVAGVSVSINGGGNRTIQNGDTLSGCEINSILIVTDATGTVIVQAVGTGD